jgi:hypothetical protein
MCKRLFFINNTRHTCALLRDHYMLERNMMVAFCLLVGSVSALAADPIVTESTNTSTITSDGNMTTTIKQPPPSAISPQFSAGNNSDLCTIGVAGAVQTQILGISAGTTFTEDNCIRLKNAKVLYDMGMKVAAVSVMCQDKKVFSAMLHAGTPCPYNGQIGEAARLGWESHVETTKEELKQSDKLDVKEKAVFGIGGLAALLLLL